MMDSLLRLIIVGLLSISSVGQYLPAERPLFSGLAPTAVDDAYEVDEDTELSVPVSGTPYNGVLANDTDPEIDDLSVQIATPPQHGTLNMNTEDGSFTYKPNLNWNAGDSFTYQAYDGSALSNLATVTLSINPVNDPPVANAQSPTTNEDTPIDLTLTGSDVDGTPLTYTIVPETGPSHGALTGTPPNVTYTPAANYHGTDAFDFQVSDGELIATATVSLTITSIPDVPVAGPQSITTNEDTPVGITLTATDGDEDILVYTIVPGTGPINGDLSGTPPNIAYTPDANFHGADGFTFQVSDGSHTATATITLTVTSVPDAPVANPQTVTTAEDSAVAITLTGTDGDNDPLTYSIVSGSGPTKGALTGTPPHLTFTPTANLNGADSFDFQVSDGALTNTARVSINITPANDPPVAHAQSQSTPEDTPIALTLTGNDIDGDPLTYTIVPDSGPTHGILSGTPPNVSYTPALNYHGPDSFVFQVEDPSHETATAAVSLTVTPVNDAPVANPQTQTTAEDTPIVLVLTATDIDGDGLTYSIVPDTGPTNGILTGTPPNVTYTPNLNFNGADSFTFQVTDGQAPATAVVSLTVTPVNDAPVPNPQTQTTAEDTPIVLVLTATDIDGDGLTYSIVPGTGPTNGILTGTPPNVTYTPNLNYNGADSFTFQVTDGQTPATAVVSLTVTPVNDDPVASPQSLTTLEDTVLNITLAGTDVDGDPLTYSIVEGSGPTKGTLSGTLPNLVYTPGANLNGADSFIFQVSDLLGRTSTATINLTITPVNDAPVGVNDGWTTNEDTPLLIDPGRTVLSNDTDVDSTTLTAVRETGPASGSLTLNADGTFIYTPVLNFNGVVTFTYRVSDGSPTLSNLVTVTITVLAVNDAPVAGTAESYSTDEDIPLTVTTPGLLANDTDVDGDTLHAVRVTQPAHGTLSDLSTGGFTYTPNRDYNGGDSFTYRVTDGFLASANVTVNITIRAVNDPPASSPDDYAVGREGVVIIDAPGVLENDFDVEEDPITVKRIVDQPLHGSLVLNPDGSFVYYTELGWIGTVTFTYVATDGQADGQVTTVTIELENESAIEAKWISPTGNIGRSRFGGAETIPLKASITLPPGFPCNTGHYDCDKDIDKYTYEVQSIIVRYYHFAGGVSHEIGDVDEPPYVYNFVPSELVKGVYNEIDFSATIRVMRRDRVTHELTGEPILLTTPRRYLYVYRLPWENVHRTYMPFATK